MVFKNVEQPYPPQFSEVHNAYSTSQDLRAACEIYCTARLGWPATPIMASFIVLLRGGVVDACSATPLGVSIVMLLVPACIIRTGLEQAFESSVVILDMKCTICVSEKHYLI